MYQDLLKDTADELDELKQEIEGRGWSEKQEISILRAMLHVLREVDKRVDGMGRKIEELERLAADHGEELRNLRRRLERRT